MAAAVALLVLTTMAFYGAIVSPVFSLYYERADVLDRARRMSEGYEKAIDDLPRLRQLSRTRATDAGNARQFLAGGSDASAGAALQSQVKDLVEGEGADVTSATVLPPQVKDGFERIGVHTVFSGDLATLTTILQSIELARPALTVGNLELSAPAEANEDENPELSIGLDVFGYREK